MSRVGRVSVGILAVLGITIGLFGATDLLSGAASDPAIAVAVSGRTPGEVEADEPAGYRLYDFASRTNGLSLALIGVLLTSTVLIPYRDGRRWAWRLLWALPAWALAVPAIYAAVGTPGAPPAPPTISGPIMAAVSAVTLIADRRRFVEARVAELWIEPRPRMTKYPAGRRRQFGRLPPFSGSKSARIAR